MTSLDHQKKKWSILRAFVRAHQHQPAQGSEEWLQLRKGIIGGSEIATITGDSPFNTIADLVQQKTGLSSFQGNLATKWGHLFEFLHVVILKELCGVDRVYSCGSVAGAIPHHRFSPDGLTVVTIDNEAVIVLLEFKSPLRSIPLGSVPKYYRPQVLAGLHDIDICEMGLFSNAMFRLCTVSQFCDNGRYLHQFHASDAKKKFASDRPLAMGIMTLFQTDEQRKARSEYSYVPEECTSFLSAQFDESIEEDTSLSIFDIEFNVGDKVDAMPSLKEAEIFVERMLDEVQRGWLSVQYGPLVVFHDRFTLPRQLGRNPAPSSLSPAECLAAAYAARQRCSEKHTYVGALAWKCFAADVLLVEKVPGYLNTFEKKIAQVIHDVQLINAAEDKWGKFTELYD